MTPVEEARYALCKHVERMWYCQDFYQAGLGWAMAKEGGTPGRLIYELFELLYKLQRAEREEEQSK